MASPSILRIERLNYMIGGLLVIVAALTQDRPVALGIAVGAGLTCVNFFVLRKLVVKWTNDAAAAAADPSGKRAGGGYAPLLMLPKMVGLMGAVAVAILFLPINVIAFVIGYSIFIVSIVVDTSYAALASKDQPHG
jgi:hypothetical protein